MNDDTIVRIDLAKLMQNTNSVDALISAINHTMDASEPWESRYAGRLAQARLTVFTWLSNMDTSPDHKETHP